MITILGILIFISIFTAVFFFNKSPELQMTLGVFLIVVSIATAIVGTIANHWILFPSILLGLYGAFSCYVKEIYSLGCFFKCTEVSVYDAMLIEFEKIKEWSKKQ